MKAQQFDDSRWLTPKTLDARIARWWTSLPAESQRLVLLAPDVTVTPTLASTMQRAGIPVTVDITAAKGDDGGYRLPLALVAFIDEKRLLAFRDRIAVREASRTPDGATGSPARTAASAAKARRRSSRVALPWT